MALARFGLFPRRFTSSSVTRVFVTTSGRFRHRGRRRAITVRHVTKRSRTTKSDARKTFVPPLGADFSATIALIAVTADANADLLGTRPGDVAVPGAECYFLRR